MMRYGFEQGSYGMLGGFGSFLMILFMLLLLALVILGIMALVRYLQIGHRSKTAPPVDDSAMMILNERYARGEINDEEFNEKKTMLNKV